MRTNQKNKIVEDDVMFHDIDTVLYENYREQYSFITPTPSSDTIKVDVDKFFHWLVDCNRLDWYDVEEGRICSNGCSNSAESFWHDLAISREGDKLLNEYLTPAELAQTQTA